MKNFRLSLWTALSSVDAEFYNFVRDGKFDDIVINAGQYNADNSITYYFTKETLQDFVNKLRLVNSNIRVYADLLSHAMYEARKPDLSTVESRQKLVDNTIKFFDDFSGLFYGIIDDLEAWSGSDSNQMHYFTQAAEQLKSLNIPYYPWLRYQKTVYTKAEKCAVGLYDSHAYPEIQWKQALNTVQNNTKPVEYYGKTGYMIFLIAESREPTIKTQLMWLDEELQNKSFNEMEVVGIWWYKSTDAEAKKAWVDWYNDDSIPPDPVEIKCPDCNSYFDNEQDAISHWDKVHLPIPPTPSVPYNFSRMHGLMFHGVPRGIVDLAFKVRNRFISERVHNMIHPLI